MPHKQALDVGAEILLILGRLCMPDDPKLAPFLELQAILCCPQSKSSLSLVSAAELLPRLPKDQLSRVPEGIVGAFVSEASLTAYPIVGRIINFLELESLKLSQRESIAPTEPLLRDQEIQLRVKRWYDEFGWQRNESGVYNDTALFSQASLSAHGLYELSSHLSFLDRLAGGSFILDAASGAIAHPEYLAFSWFHQRRVCVDLSLTALREADAKLAGTGFCCMASICQLPFRDNVFNGVVSGYTIQHIADSQQIRAVTELYRVLKPGGHLCIISDLEKSRGHKLLMMGARAIRKILKADRFNGAPWPSESTGVAARHAPPCELYFKGRDIAWWRRLARSLTGSYSLEGLRLFQMEEFQFLFADSMQAARTVRALETLFPKLSARMCAYLLVDLYKRPAVSDS
jgi:ubiquinone/menaquinone biosynthesis C-methylase UbiE/uncharacterized protein YbaR (Trm112 family)